MAELIGIGIAKGTAVLAEQRPPPQGLLQAISPGGYRGLQSAAPEQV